MKGGKQMTLRHLKIFVTVCNCNSITAAAEKLYLAQPSVSLAISELEKYYGIKLFDRISKKLYLTEPGVQLLDYATHIVALFDEMEKDVRNWESVGVLRIGSSVTIGSFLLPKWVKLFQKQHPNIKIRVSIFKSEQIERMIMSDQVDIALIEGIVHNSQIKSIKFKDEELVLICGKEHPLFNVDEIEIEMLKEYEFILREKEAEEEIFLTA